jgi:hypothetical protein
LFRLLIIFAIMIALTVFVAIVPVRAGCNADGIRLDNEAR